MCCPLEETHSEVKEWKTCVSWYTGLYTTTGPTACFFLKCNFHRTTTSEKIEEFTVLILDRVQSGLHLPMQSWITLNS